VSPFVRYEGPVDSDDASVVYNLPGKDGNLVLPLHESVEVSGADLKRLRADKAHNFKTGKQAADEAPWPDYDDLNADQVLERLGDPSQATVAEAVVEYEKAHEKRKTVLDAAEHQVEANSVNGETA
jgi:hypothetical protein